MIRIQVLESWRAAMLAGVVVLAGCASADVEELRDYEGAALPKPDRVVVYDFAYAPEPDEADSPADGQPQAALSAEEIAYGREIANLLQAVLVEEIRAMGLPAERIEDLSRTQGTMLMIHGQFLSVNEGSGAARFLIGFGAGRTKVVTRTQVYHFTPQRQRLIEEFEVVATSGSKPGFILPLGVGSATGNLARSVLLGGTAGVASEVLGADVVSDTQRTGEELAESLEDFFEQQGWL